MGGGGVFGSEDEDEDEDEGPAAAAGGNSYDDSQQGEGEGEGGVSKMRRRMQRGARCMGGSGCVEVVLFSHQ